ESTAFLWTISLNEDITKEAFIELFRKVETGASISVLPENKDLYVLTFKSSTQPFFLYLNNNTVIGSFSKELLQKAADDAEPKIGKEFIAEINAGSQPNGNSPFNLFVNHQKLPDFTERYLRSKLNGPFDLLKNIDGFSALNMNFKSDAIMFNGISTIEHSETAYLNLFLRQHPVQNTIKKIMPQHTANFLAMGFSDYPAFHTALLGLFKKRGELERLEKQTQQLQSQTGTDLKRNIQPFIG